MKAVYLALLALMLTACSTFNPIKPVAVVYPAPGVMTEQATTPASDVTFASAPQAEKDVLIAALPAPVPSDSLPPPVEEESLTPLAVSEKQLACMALAIYHEARGEPERGQAAVGWVILNRVEHPRYPDTICGVVYERNRRGCQFSWVCDKRSDVPRDKASYTRAMEIARRVVTRQYPNPVGKAIYFDGYVHGRGARLVGGYTQIGNHRFFTSFR